MNILELCLSPNLGGLELYAYHASETLRKNHELVAVLNTAGKLTDHFSTHSDTQVFNLNSGFKSLPLINAYKLARIIDAMRIDIIHMHWGNDLALAAFAKLFSSSKPKLVYTRHMKITRRKDDFYHDFIYGKMDLMLAITKNLESEAKHFISRHSSRIKTLYHGVKQPDAYLSNDEITESRKTLGLHHQDFVIGLFGRLEKDKGQHLLIQAISLAKQDGTLIHALIVGHEMNPGYLEKLKAISKSLNIESQIRFHEFTPRPQQLMQLCNCITLASTEETFGLVLPEAMRTGICVIGSNKGGVPEIIDHKQTGLLFDSGNASSLYTQIVQLYTDRTLTKKLAKNGQAKADKVFNIETHFLTLETILSELLTKANSA